MLGMPADRPWICRRAGSNVKLGVGVPPEGLRRSDWARRAGSNVWFCRGGCLVPPRAMVPPGRMFGSAKSDGYARADVLAAGENSYSGGMTCSRVGGWVSRELLTVGVRYSRDHCSFQENLHGKEAHSDPRFLFFFFFFFWWKLVSVFGLILICITLLPAICL